MNKLILSASFLILGFSSYAQDSTKIKIGDRTIIIIEKSGDTSVTKNMELGDYVDSLLNEGKAKEVEQKKKEDKELAHWGGFEMGVSGLLNSKGSTTLNNSLYDLNYSKSWVFNLNLFETKMPIFKGYAGIVSGLGFSWNGYSFKQNTTLVSTSSYTTPQLLEGTEGIDFSKNKLKVTYVKLPLLLELNTSLDPDKTFHVAAGVEGGFKIGSKTKQRYELGGDEFKFNQKGHYNLNPWKLSAVARVGYKNFTVFANYGLTTLFEKGKGDEMYPFEVGITLVGM